MTLAGTANAVATSSPTAPLVDVNGLTVSYRARLGRRRVWFDAVRGVSFALAPGTTTALVGESGSGKSSTARALLDLVPRASGSIRLDGIELAGTAGRAERASRRAVRQRMQMVFQDPFASLNPSMTIGAAIGEAALFHGRASRGNVAQMVAELLRAVGLNPDMATRFPREFSGGQRQRVAIARALAPEPDVLICDEAVSALDVTTQRQVLDVLSQLQSDRGLTTLFITHDLGVARLISHQTIVMYTGTVVESGPSDELFRSPAHPYTRALVDSVPRPRAKRQASRPKLAVSGETSNPLQPPDGCPYQVRCSIAIPKCATDRPVLEPRFSDRSVACHVVGEEPHSDMSTAGANPRADEPGEFRRVV